MPQAPEGSRNVRTRYGAISSIVVLTIDWYSTKSRFVMNASNMSRTSSVRACWCLCSAWLGLVPALLLPLLAFLRTSTRSAHSADTQYALRSRLPLLLEHTAVSARLSARTCSSSASWNVCHRCSASYSSIATIGVSPCSLGWAQ